MGLTHEPWLVALSVLVAFQGSFVGLSMAIRVRDARDARRRMLLAGSALTLALGIWSMHFVGMLAAQLPVAVDFLVLPTLLSFLICVLVVGLAVFTAARRRGGLTRLRLLISAFVMGAGIATMHYLGMLALHASSHMTHDPRFVGASFLVAFCVSGLALWLAFGTVRRPPVLVSALALALAISAMHYIAMAGMSLMPMEGGGTSASSGAPAVSPGILAIIVSVVAFLVSGLFLLTLVPETEEAEPPLALSAPTPAAQPGGATASSEQARPGEDDVAEQMTSVAALAALSAVPANARDGLAEPLRRAALGLQSAPDEARLRSQLAVGGLSLPIERDGGKARLAVGEIVAVQADAHYTRVFDLQRAYFCPLSITEVERLLDGRHFTRVHRSHIVNLGRVRALRRAGDSGLVLLEGSHGHSAPVSRSKWPRLKSRVAGSALNAAE
ncbi:MAG: MHYT domain-containing protein [Pannonibacter sp.]